MAKMERDMKKSTIAYVLIAGLQSSTGERKNRLTTTATTTDNEGNSESVHRSRMPRRSAKTGCRSRQPTRTAKGTAKDKVER